MDHECNSSPPCRANSSAGCILTQLPTVRNQTEREAFREDMRPEQRGSGSRGRGSIWKLESSAEDTCRQIVRPDSEKLKTVVLSVLCSPLIACGPSIWLSSRRMPTLKSGEALRSKIFLSRIPLVPYRDLFDRPRSPSILSVNLGG